MPVRMDNDDLNALMTVGSSGVCAKMLERERATSMGLRRAAGPSGSVAGGIQHCDWVLRHVSDPIWRLGAWVVGLLPNVKVGMESTGLMKFSRWKFGRNVLFSVFPHRHRSL